MEKTSKEKLDYWQSMRNHGDAKKIAQMCNKSVQSIYSILKDGTKYKGIESMIDSYFANKKRNS